MKWQNFLDCLPDAVVDLEGDSGLSFLLAPLELNAKLDEEKFIEDQPDVRGRARSLQVHQAFADLGPVRLPERLLEDVRDGRRVTEVRVRRRQLDGDRARTGRRAA